MSNAADGCILVIFGASGDLTRRKLLPAVYNLIESGHLPDRFAILGVARPVIDDAAYRTQMRERVADIESEALEPEKWRRIEERLHYIAGEFNDAALYARLAEALDALQRRHGIPPNVLFYFAIPPDLFGTVARATAGDYRGRVVFSLPGSPAAVRLAWEQLLAPESGHLAGLVEG